MSRKWYFWMVFGTFHSLGRSVWANSFFIGIFLLLGFNRSHLVLRQFWFLTLQWPNKIFQPLFHQSKFSLWPKWVFPFVPGEPWQSDPGKAEDYNFNFPSIVLALRIWKELLQGGVKLKVAMRLLCGFATASSDVAGTRGKQAMTDAICQFHHCFLSSIV